MLYPTYRRFLVTIQIAIGGIILFPWLVSTTPPKDPPYHQYIIKGGISRDSSGDLRNHVAVLYGKRNRIGDGEFRQIRNPSSSQKKNDDQVGLSDSTGAFQIYASSYAEFDSLMIAVLAPDRPTIFSLPFHPDSNTVSYDIDYYSDDSGCSCVTSPETLQDTVGYIYRVIPAISIKLPY